MGVLLIRFVVVMYAFLELQEALETLKEDNGNGKGMSLDWEELRAVLLEFGEVETWKNAQVVLDKNYCFFC